MTSSTDAGRARGPAHKQNSAGRQDWSSWPVYEHAVAGLPNYWYPVLWAAEVRDKPVGATICDTKLVLVREGDEVRALHDRCPHRGVPLSLGTIEFPGTVSCPYHGWTYRLGDGELCAVITDGPDSPVCGKVRVQTFPTAQRLGIVWVYIGDGEPHDIDAQLPEELTTGHEFALGGRIADRTGDWRFAAENGFDEGHAKFLHRTSTWRTFKAMPTWNLTRIVPDGRWLYRVQDEVHWDAEFPGVGRWTNKRWWKINPPEGESFQLGNTGAPSNPDPYITGRRFPGFASISLPGVLRIAYPQFIHYEFYVPTSPGNHRYVGVMVQFKRGLGAAWFLTRYLLGIRWLFHGNFSNLDAWMVEAMAAPPERLYRPDSSLIAWRRLVEGPNPFHPDSPAPDGSQPLPAANLGTRVPSRATRLRKEEK